MCGAHKDFEEEGVFVAKNNISAAVIKRLPRYYRFLTELNNDGVDKISSTKLAQSMHATASQVRQDLNCFGGFGQQGYGYSVKYLKEQIGNILGLNVNYKAALFGLGNMGRAVALHIDLKQMGFELSAIFDKDEAMIGRSLRGVRILSFQRDFDRFLENNKIDVAFLCVPKSSAAPIIDRLYEKGIKSFWNFSHYDITRRYEDVIVENVHINESLMLLSYKMNAENLALKDKGAKDD